MFIACKKLQCQTHGNVLARSTNCSKTIGGSEIPSCTCQTASLQATSRSYSWGNGWAAGLGVRWSGVCHLSTYCGPLSPHMTHVMSLQTITPNSPSEVCYITPRRGCRCNDLDSPGCCWVLKHIHTYTTFTQTQGATGLRITHICTHANKYILYHNSLYLKCLHVYSAGGVWKNACWRKTTCSNEFLHVYTIYEHVCECVVQYFIWTLRLRVCGCVTTFISEGDICYTKIFTKKQRHKTTRFICLMLYLIKIGNSVTFLSFITLLLKLWPLGDKGLREGWGFRWTDEQWAVSSNTAHCYSSPTWRTWTQLLISRSP